MTEANGSKPEQDQAVQDVGKVEETLTDGQVDTSEEQEELKPATIPPVTIRLPAPAHGRTLPKRTPPEDYTTFTLYPQNHDTIQELKLAVNEWVGGYWLGPYALRLPKQTKANGHAGAQEEGVASVKAGESLSEYLEVREVFGDSEEDRVLEVVKEPYSDFTARQTVLRLLELIYPGGSSSNHLTSPLAYQTGSTIFESVRDGTVSSLIPEIAYEEVEVPIPTGKKGKNGKKETVKIKREVNGDPDHPFRDWKWRTTPLDQLPLAQPPLETSPCIKAMQLSQFNPPLPHLRQQGHQLYLQVALLEGETVTLVCTSRGWFVSKSNVNQFDPSPKSPTFHSLIDLLHSISPKFTEQLNKLSPLSMLPPALEPLSTVPVPQAEPAYPFLANLPKSNPPELLRTQLAYLHTGSTTTDGLESTRDWNEEMQGIKDLPKTNMQERSIREKMLQKTLTEFTQASVRGVLAVARGDIIPLNPNEDSRAHMWLYSNIFVTKAVDSIDAYAHLGGDAAAFVSHAKDAAGVRILHKLDIDGIHLLGHTVIDWQGERWVCQSTLPGIFGRRKDEEDWVKVEGKQADGEIEETSAQPEDKVDNQLIVYGLDSEDQGSIHWDEASHRVMEKVANAHRLAAHKVKDAKGEEKEFYASAEVKALKGTDGRRYLLDLPRLSPVDVEWLEKDIENYPHRVVLLRPELLELFWENELKRYARTITKDEEDEKIDPAALGEKLKDFELKINPDAFVDFPPKKGEEGFTPSSITDESDPAIKAVRDASIFLRNVAVQAIVVDSLTGNLSGIMDGTTLTRHLHSRGVNVRYLGLLAETIAKFATTKEGEPIKNGHLVALERVVKQELVFRGSKHVLRRVVAGLQAEHVPHAISHFLNCLFGKEYNPNPTASFEPILDNDTKPVYTSLTPDSVHEAIITEIDNRYRYKLDSLASAFRPRQLLRELASRFAFQLQQRDYSFEKTESTKRSTIFESTDILTLVPVVRSTAPTVTVAEEIFEAGRNTISRGNTDLGLEFMAEAISMYENIHSVVHPEVAAAYNQYASTLHQLARLKIQQLSPENLDPEQPLGIDIAAGLRLQRQAVIVAERTLGVYHPDTVGYYFNLAMLENLEGNAVAALRYFKHCLTLWDVIHGPGHPEVNTILSNAGVVLQATNENTASLNLLTQAVSLTTEQFGEDHLSTGQALHQLTQAHFLVNDIQSAFTTSQKAFDIFKSRLGEDHAQTKELSRNVELLKVVIENAERQKQASKAQVERIKASAKLGGLGRYKKVDESGNVVIAPPAAGAAGTAESSATGAAKSNIGVKGELDVDELVSFINGGGAGSGAGGSKTGRGKNNLRGKRRTGAKR